MERTDAMIMLMTLYNRIQESGLSKVAVEASFKNKVAELTREGHVTSDVAKFALAYMIPSVMEKEVASIKEIAIKEEKDKSARTIGGYSKSANVDKINSILDQAMKKQDKSKNSVWKPPVSNVDPCSCYHTPVSSC